MASSDLLLKTLLAGQNPELAAAMPRMDMAQALMSQGMSAAPAVSPWEGISRVGQALLGGYLYNQGQNDLQGVVGRRQKETEAGLSALSGASPTPAPPPSMTGGSPPPSNAFEPQLAAAEAPNPGTVNASGHSGQYQFSTGRLADLGAYTPAPGENLKANEWKGTFNVPGFANVRSQADFLGNPQAQKAVFGTHIADVDRAIDQMPGGASLSRDGLRAVAHLGGTEGMRKFVETGGQYNPADANGTKLSDYYQRFAGGGASPASAPVTPQYSPVTQQAMDTIKRANQVMSLPQFQNNAAVQDAAKRSIEFAKTLMEQDKSARTEAGVQQRHAQSLGQSAQQFQVGQAQSERHFNAGSLPSGYQRTPEGGAAPTPGVPQGTLPTGMRFGAAGTAEPIPGVPVKPGESGPFAGNAMEAQANNVLLSIGPKMTNGTATEQERGQYALAYEHLSQGRIMPVPDPSDPKGERQMLARIPGAVPAQFPNPNAGQVTPSVGGTPSPSGAAGGPQPIPGTTKAAPPTTEDEKKAAGFAVRMRETGQELNKLEESGVHSGNFWQSTFEKGGALGRSMQDPKFQVYQQQMEDWVRAKLRRESGAVIGRDEMADEFKTYFPQPGDTPEKIAAKRRSRETAQLGMETGGGRARIEVPEATSPKAIPAPPPGFKVIP